MTEKPKDKTLEKIKSLLATAADLNKDSVSTVLAVVNYKDTNETPSVILTAPEDDAIDLKKLSTVADTLLDTAKQLYLEINILSMQSALNSSQEVTTEVEQDNDVMTQSLDELFNDGPAMEEKTPE